MTQNPTDKPDAFEGWVIVELMSAFLRTFAAGVMFASMVATYGDGYRRAALFGAVGLFITASAFDYRRRR